MGAELYGYPPEEDYRTVPHSEIAKLHDIAARKVNEANEKVAELERQLEATRRQKVAEEYGIVTERHIWNVTMSVPRAMLSFAHTNKAAQVVTAGRCAAEAAMVAEALAKGISDKATVIGISYANETNALK